MTPPSVSEDMIRAALQAYHLDPYGRSLDERMTAALIAALARLPAGSEAVKPVGWQLGYDCGANWSTAIYPENEALEYLDKAASVELIRPVYAAPPSTPPAANVQEGEVMAWLVRPKGEYRYGDEASPEWGVTRIEPSDYDMKYREYQPLALRSKQAPTVAVLDGDVVEVGRSRTFADVLETIIEGRFYEDYDQSIADIAILRARAEQRETPSVVVGEGEPFGWFYRPLPGHPWKWTDYDPERSFPGHTMEVRRALAAAPTSDGR